MLSKKGFETNRPCNLTRAFTSQTVQLDWLKCPGLHDSDLGLEIMFELQLSRQVCVKRVCETTSR